MPPPLPATDLEGNQRRPCVPLAVAAPDAHKGERTVLSTVGAIVKRVIFQAYAASQRAPLQRAEAA